jgi:hypothetical protein
LEFLVQFRQIQGDTGLLNGIWRGVGSDFLHPSKPRKRTATTQRVNAVLFIIIGRASRGQRSAILEMYPRNAAETLAIRKPRVRRAGARCYAVGAPTLMPCLRQYAALCT